MRLLVALCMMVAVAVSAGPARASVYTFVAQCGDCTGPSGTPLVTATLVLSGDTPGQPADASTFVSFSYGGSDRAPAFTILPSDQYAVRFSALFLDQATQFADVSVQGLQDGSANVWDFTTGTDGGFNLALIGTLIGNTGGVDQGTGATWTLDAALVPEAPSFALLGVGLVAAIAATWRRPAR